MPLTRRHFLGAASAVALAAVTGCMRGPSSASGAKRLVCYCSADSVYAQLVFDAFTKRTGVIVDPVYDTEATKTTGLVNRLLSEKDRPRADVWWSSEPLGTIRLARAGVLEAYRSAIAEQSMAPAGWPAAMKDRASPSGTPRWYGFGARARVYVVNTAKVEDAARPTSHSDLVRSGVKGRIAIARPQFGTTRTHMAAILAIHGPQALERWLSALKALDVRVLDGNAAVARAVGEGSCHVGLTDSDDVFAGQAQRWPIDLSFDRAQPQISAPDLNGSLLIPNTVALVRNGPNAPAAGVLVDHILSAESQRILATSESKNIPIDPALHAEFASWAPKDVLNIDFERVADAVEEAMAICTHVLG